MKKFLTVLLALSVVFTYTFGTAFADAATPVVPVVPAPNTQIAESTVRADINDAADKAIKALTDAKSAAIEVVMETVDTPSKAITITVDNKAQKIIVTRADLDKVYTDELFDAGKAKIEAKRTAKLLAVDAAVRKTTNYKGYFTTVTGSDDAHEAAGYAVFDTNLAGYDLVATYTESVTFPVAFTAVDGLLVDELATAVFNRVVKDAEAYFAKIDLNNYSKAYNNQPKSNYDKVVKLVGDANAALATAKAAVAAAKDNEGWATAAAQITSIGTDVYTPAVGNADPTGIITVAILGVPKVADEPTEATKLQYAQEKVLNEVIAQINTALKTASDTHNNTILEQTLLGSKGDAAAIAKAKKDLAEAKEAAAAAIDVVTYLVKDTESVDQLLGTAAKFTDRLILKVNLDAKGDIDPNGTDKTNVPVWNYTAGTLTVGTTVGSVAGKTKLRVYTKTETLAIVEKIADLKAEAEILKQTIGIDSSKYVEIEKALTDAIDSVYKTKAGSLGKVTAVSNLYARQEALIADANVTINGKQYTGVNAWIGTLATSYDEQYFDEARNAVSAAKTAIRAAKTVADAEAAFVAEYTKFDAVPTISDRVAGSTTKEFFELKAQYTKEITKYAAYKAEIASTKDYDWDQAEMAKKLVKTLDDAYNVTELKTLYTEAKAKIDGLKTITTLKAEKAAIEAKIAALPKVLTIADRAVVGALDTEISDSNDYCDLINKPVYKVVTSGQVTAAYEKIKALEVAAIIDAIKAIDTVTLDDAKAIEALRTSVDDFVKYYAGEDATDKEIKDLKDLLTYAGKTVDTLETALSNKQVEAFQIMVAKLPADGSDVKGIKAARAAYEALSNDAKYQAGGAYQSAAYDKLVDLEKLAKKDIKTGVLETTLTATSKATKGAIKISWKKSAGYKVDGYQVYKSTKKFSGFKKAFTTKATSYKNTKGLKAGKTYFYKVRGFRTIDGVKYYTQWSTKVSRVAK